MNKKTLKIIITRFYEDVSWVSTLKHDYIVFNKNPKDYDKYENNLPDKGLCEHTFFKYIVENYDNLPDYLANVQGNPFDHFPETVELINAFDFTGNFLPLGKVYYRDGKTFIAQALSVAKQANIQCNLPIKYVSGNQFIVSKESILKRSKQSYIDVLNIYPDKPKTHWDFGMEYVLPTILNFADELTPCNKWGAESEQS